MRRRSAVGISLIVVAIGLALVLWSPVARHVRAAKLLLGFQSGEAPAVAHSDGALAGLRARRYGDPSSRPVLLLHGVHPEGIDEPRLCAFAAQLVERGFYVVTPELAGLAELRFDPDTTEQVRAAAEALARESGTPSLGVVGVSVGGGVAIRASTMTRAIHAVLAIGAHHDVASLLPRWVDQTDERYGVLALAHAFEDEYFTTQPQAGARAIVASLIGASPPRLDEVTRAELAALRADPIPAAARARLTAIRDRHRAELDALSPRPALGRVRARVFLLHGAEDPLIPPSESEANAAGLPDAARGGVVVTPLLRHADGADADLAEQWRVVHLSAEALAAL